MRYIEAIAQDWGVSKVDKKSDTDDSDTNPYHHLEDAVLPSLDDLKCRFRGVEMFGHEKVDAVAKRVDHCFRIPATPTVGQSEPLTADQRRALRTKIKRRRKDGIEADLKNPE
ncbi:hypothetical protein Pmar_PMAR021604 [Perkinsus marinus ATCC 50983]|uniref:Uncharacterized protein n=1 Tax=Perkinsus marinus (strain ATCC 50983 / TXsc) TaxID=423536 RepID=C5L8L7_PERM5|nr:hypothetical protein Pmar_PMAR021604 [Perkinsus marinus ATCC 50983]EER06930.1 hypothetical protein Pmar_PMAR021604 [Perkinsus marinus ATCC 50983]|eukprot:XP_002775114.1 hypothetical protein Pmar_PMAR021604 [Perkinsus marinus ATCC 50983]